MTVSHTRGTVITACVVTAILLTMTVCCVNGFAAATFSARYVLFAACLAASLGIGAMIAFRVQLHNPIIRQCLHTVTIFLLPIVTITMTEALNGIFVYNMTYFGFALNYITVLLLEMTVYAIGGSLRWSVLIINPLLYVMSMVNHFMKMFRGSPFVPMDFFSLKVADTILGEYTYKLTYPMVISTILLAFLVVLGVRMRTPPFKKWINVVSRSVCGVAVAAVMIVFFCTSAFANAGLAPDFWNQSRGYRNYGFVYSFFLNTKYLSVPAPDGYDAEKIEEYVQETLENAEEYPLATETPDIICIMNESLADLSVLGNVNTNIDPLPYISSLTENTVRGNLYVPVIGAGTANTEFEFLTGNSLAFLPSGSNAYILYVKENLPTIARQLSAQNYSVRALHPYFGRGWNRVNVYDKLGMPEFFSLEHLLDMDIINQYQTGAVDVNGLAALMGQEYPGEEILVRQYMRDSHNYAYLLGDYQERDTSQPYFMFNITMQNHGGYRVDADNFDQRVWLTDTDAYPETNRFLSLLKYSDDAFRDLIAYYEQVDRPVVICMFGDHQPAIEEEFVEETIGASIGDLTLQQQQSRQITPFLIWANYDIEEGYIERLSSNYLSSLLFKTAGVKMSDYQRYLWELSKEVPVVDTVGYIDAEGNHYSWNSTSLYTEKLKEYERIQYNGLLDGENRKENVFYVK